MMLTGIQALPFAAGGPSRESLLNAILSHAPEFSLAARRDPLRGEVETFIAARFRAAYGASISEFFPLLLAMRCGGRLSAAAGLRPAADRRLFLEQYLDRPVEAALELAAGRTVARGTLVEVGNLVAARRGASQILFLFAAALLYEAGAEWMVFTATRGLLNNLENLGYATLSLGTADPARLSRGCAADWGSYYDSRPSVVAGRLDEAMRAIGRHPVLRRMLGLYRERAAQLALDLDGLADEA